MANALTELDLYIYKPENSGNNDDANCSWEENFTVSSPGIIHLASEQIQSHSTSITDATFASGTRGLRPESVYCMHGVGKDSYNNTITSETTRFLTKRDYPVFNKMSVGHAIITSNDKIIFNNEFNQSYNFDIITTSSDKLKIDVRNNTKTVLVSPNDADLKVQLNGNLLSESKYIINHLTDYSDANLLDPEYEGNGNNRFKRINRYNEIENLDTSTNHYIKYYDFNSFQPNKMTLVEFNALNKYTGIHSFSGTVLYGEENISFNIDPSNALFVQNHYLNNLGSQIEPFFIDTASYNPLVYTTDIESSLNYKNKLYKSPDLNVNSTEYDKIDTNAIIFNSKNWYDKTEDSYWELDIKVKPSSRRPVHPTMSSLYYNDNQNTVSDFDIHFWTLFPPKHELYYNESGRDDIVTPGSGNTYYQLQDYSKIVFSPFNSGSGHGYNFKTFTDARRPYMSLVNEVFNKNNPILGLTNTTNYTPENSAQFFSNDISNYLDNPKRATTYILEMSSPLTDQDITDISYNPDTSSNISSKFKTISLYDPIIEQSSESTCYPGIKQSYDEKLLNTIQSYNEDIENKVLYKPSFSRIQKVHTLSNGNATKTDLNMITWPSSNLIINTLIPGKYYGFRLTASNYCGTTTNVFIFKTKEAEPNTLYSTVYKSGTSGNEISSNTDAGGITINIEPNDILNIQASFVLGDGNDLSGTSPHYMEVTYSSDGGLGEEISISNSNATQYSWPLLQHSFDSEGLYALFIKTPRHQKNNDSSNTNVFTHTYFINVSSNPTTSITTDNASNITINSAKLNGTVSVTGTHSPSKAQKFLFATSSLVLDSVKELTDQSSITAPIDVTEYPVSPTKNNGAFFYNATGLTANTTYYYVACAKNQHDRWYSGTIKSFTTDDNANINITVNSITRTGATITFQ